MFFDPTAPPGGYYSQAATSPGKVVITVLAADFGGDSVGTKLTYEVGRTGGGERDNQVIPIGNALPMSYTEGDEISVIGGVPQSQTLLPVGLTMRLKGRNNKNETWYTPWFVVPGANANLKDILFPG